MEECEKKKRGKGWEVRRKSKGGEERRERKSTAK